MQICFCQKVMGLRCVLKRLMMMMIEYITFHAKMMI